MSFWALKVQPRERELKQTLRTGESTRWRVRRPAPPWQVGDGVFFWQSARIRHLAGYGTIESVGAPGPDGRTVIEVRNGSVPFVHPIALHELQRDPETAGAPFLKPSTPVASGLGAGEVTGLIERIARRNPMVAEDLAHWRASVDDADRARRPADPDGEGMDGAARVRAPEYPMIDETWTPYRMISFPQPRAELVMRGELDRDFRGMRTLGKGRAYVYAGAPDRKSPLWEKLGIRPEEVPHGVIIGTVEVLGCEYSPLDLKFAYKLANPERLDTPVKPKPRGQRSTLRPF